MQQSSQYHDMFIINTLCYCSQSNEKHIAFFDNIFQLYYALLGKVISSILLYREEKIRTNCRETVVKPWLRTDSNKVIVINQVSSFQANAKPISPMLGTSNINLERFIQRFPRTSRKKASTARRGVATSKASTFLLCRLETSHLYKQLILKYVHTCD